MSDERLTDAQLADIEAAVAARLGRYRWVHVAVDDVAALVAEVRALRAENAEMYKSLMDYSGLEDDK